MPLDELIATLKQIRALRQDGRMAEALAALKKLRPVDFPKFNVSSGCGFKFDGAGFLFYMDHDWDDRDISDGFLHKVLRALMRILWWEGRERPRAQVESEPEYETWRRMRRRCYETSHKSYRDYGGRGITVYGPWQDDYQSFREWILKNIGPKPSPQHSLDRIDNNGNYEPGNLRWATVVVQMTNRRGVRTITFGGRTMSRHAWCIELGFDRGQLRDRLDRMPLERAMNPSEKMPRKQKRTSSG